ncbi:MULTISPECIES: sensor histidine kinase [Providencia]|uniref:sensor histidine kinase n=1 Tax=Providencia TaxID=586 RepID=UPI002349C2BD|nr:MULTISPECIES: sensor histidine kinase [unclassified Providencia]
MYILKRILISLCLCNLLFFLLNPLAISKPTSVPKEVITVGVFADRGVEEASNRWQKTIDWLNERLPEYHFTLQPLLLEQLQEEILRQRLPFIIVNPSESIRIGRKSSLSWLATLISPMDSGTKYSTGSAVWVKEESVISSIEELSGHSIGTASKQAFGGFMAFAHDVIHERKLKGYFSHLVEIGYPHEHVVDALVSGQIEGAILPVCLIESMILKGELKPNQLRILGQRNKSDAHCKVSTHLYPNWSFAMTNAADRLLAKQVVVALFDIPSDSSAAKSAQSLGWSVPESQIELDRLFTDLGVHPLQEKWWYQTWNWLINNYYATIAGLLLFAILPIQYFFLSLRYRKNYLKLRHAQESLHKVQRHALVDKLGSGLAHELNQPLAAIRLYAESEISRRNQGKLDTDITVLLDKIHRQVNRVDEVVRRFRSLLQKKAIEKKYIDINALIGGTIDLVKIYADQKHVHLHWKSASDAVFIFGDKAAIEQLLVNLLTNAIDATFQNDREQVTITLTKTNDKVEVSVYDQGTGLSMPFEKLLTPFVTTKQDGIGLGLVICKEVMESHFGEFELINLSTGGCRAVARIPIAKVK